MIPELVVATLACARIEQYIHCFLDFLLLLLRRELMIANVRWLSLLMAATVEIKLLN
jgi:hypothetical protein